MALYTISDLHLPLGVNKPMDIFGKTWENYVSRLRENWQNTIKPEDTVVLGGDFSWATYLDETKEDFKYICSLPGRKILLKGNHDYWWTTMNKMRNFLKENGFSNIEFLHNNYYIKDDFAICGTRGWSVPTGNTRSEEDEKIYSRELCRLETSLKEAKGAGAKRIAVFLHYPPLLKDFRKNPMTELLNEYNVGRCYFGHIHKNGSQNALCGACGGVEYRLCSCDYLGFAPILVENNF